MFHFAQTLSHVRIIAFTFFEQIFIESLSVVAVSASIVLMSRLFQLSGKVHQDHETGPDAARRISRNALT